MEKTFRFKLSELTIDTAPILGVMGYTDGDIPPVITETVEKELSAAFDNIIIEGGYIVKDAVIDNENFTISVGGASFNTGKDILELYKNSEQIAIYACTIGDYIEKRSKQLMNEGLVLEGYVVDVIGSIVVERGMDKIYNLIKKESEERGYKITNRYSPGYWEWNVNEQDKIFALLPDNFCGIKLTSSSLMHPVKSVSGLIGIGKTVEYKKYSCKLCSQQDCIFKKAGKQKGCSYSSAL